MSLEEVSDLQKDVSQNDKKLIFIIYDNDFISKNTNLQENTEGMVGDVDLFLNEEEDGESHTINGELNIMIAEKSSRGKGLAKEALYLIMKYAVQYKKLDQFTAKISLTNKPSIHLFTQTLKFTETQRNDVFQELTCCLKVTDNLKQILDI